MNINELQYWNTKTYGNAFVISNSVKYTIMGLYLIVAVLVPIIVPVPFVLVLKRLIPKYVRY